MIDKKLLIWYSGIGLVWVMFAVVLTHAQIFPITPLGMCMEGVEKLAGYYPGQNITFAYSSTPGQGHVWLMVDGDPIDSYYGNLPHTYKWMHPEMVFGSFDELSKYVEKPTFKQCVNTGMWEEVKYVV